MPVQFTWRPTAPDEPYNAPFTRSVQFNGGQVAMSPDCCNCCPWCKDGILPPTANVILSGWSATTMYYDVPPPTSTFNLSQVDGTYQLDATCLPNESAGVIDLCGQVEYYKTHFTAFWSDFAINKNLGIQGTTQGTLTGAFLGFMRPGPLNPDKTKLYLRGFVRVSYVGGPFGGTPFVSFIEYLKEISPGTTLLPCSSVSGSIPVNAACKALNEYPESESTVTHDGYGDGLFTVVL